MKSLIRRLIIWSTENESGPFTEPCNPHQERVPYNAGDYNIRLIKADNGHIISMGLMDSYSIHNRPPKTYTRICPEGSNVVDEIAALLATAKFEE